ncbi:MAG: methyl-accepting chemotaxis protein [Clostridia bacterium]
MSISLRNAVAFSLIFVLFAGFGFYQYQSSSTEWEHVREIENQTLKSALLADELKLCVVQVQQWLTDISATRGKDGLDDGIEKADGYAKKFLQNVEQLKQINPNDTDELVQIEAAFARYYEMGQKMAHAYIDGGPEQGNKIMGDFDKTAEAINSVVDTYRKDKLALINDAVVTIERSILLSNRMVLVICGIVLVISIAIAYLLSRSVIRPLRKLIANAKMIAGGNLTQPVTINSRDEVGLLADSFEKMRLNLHMLIQEVQRSAAEVAANSEQLAAGAEMTSEASKQITIAVHEIVEGADVQLKGAEEGTRSMEEMSSGIRKISQSSQAVADLSQSTAELARQGDKAIGKVDMQMRAIQTTTSQAATIINQLGERSDEIGSIVEVITNISSQTNLLALNAAIEAARAGEQGRGFTIVADEVRKLAEQSTASAEQISRLIAVIQADTSEAVKAMQAGIRDVEAGIQVVANAGSAFHGISDSIDLVSAQIEEVSAATEEMLAGSEQVISSVSQMEHIARKARASTAQAVGYAEEQLASVEQVAQSASQLSNRAQDLQDMAGKFQV